MSDYLVLFSGGYGINVLAFVLMSNHFHLIARPTNEKLGAALQYFMRETSKEISRLTGRINQTYGARNYKTLLGSYHYYMNTYKYVYRNPVRAGICDRVEDYPFSTLHGLLGESRLTIPVERDTLLFTPDYDEYNLVWLNQTPKPEHEDEMRRALRRSTFELKADLKTGKVSELEELLL